MMVHNPLRGFLVGGLLLLSAGFAGALGIELGAGGKGTAVVSDPAASGGEAVAARIGDEGQGQAGRWTVSASPLKPGLYSLETFVKPRLPADFDHGRLLFTLAVQAGGKTVAEKVFAPIGLDSGAYGAVTLGFSLANPSPLELVASWEIAETAAGKPKKSVQPFKAPVAGALHAPEAADPASGGSGLDDLMSDMASEKAVSLASIDYPVLLLDRCDLALVTDSLAVETVRPERVHAYPGETNPVTVTVRNYRAAPASASLTVTLQTGLETQEEIGTVTVVVPANGTMTSRFDWSSGAREFGHEMRAEVRAQGQAAHAASDCFSVSAPLWKTAIQGGGFLTWFGREKEFPGHVAGNRRRYVNVEEAFSWQPSSWTDLNPTNSHWWSGQNNFHNSLVGLRQWMALSHAEGIKLITYMWATASGPQGVEWARKYPDLVAHQQVGLGSEFHDVEDLRLYDLTHDEPALEDYQYGVWHSFSINRGYLRLIEMGADQLIRSARNFGWDGVRFDSQLTWGAMGAAEVQAELREMGAEELMRKLAPDLMGLTGAVWNAEAISVRNVLYMKHRLREGVGPRYEVASNYGPIEGGGRYFNEYCRGGSQVNQEYFRQTRSWKAFSEGLLVQVELTRRAGGYHAVQSLDAAANPGSRAYNNIFTFASGSHPYIYGEGKGSPGAYARFMTRYGEYLWDPAFAPVTPEKAGVSLKADGGLMWKPYLKQRARAGGGTETVIQVITAPGSDGVDPEKPVPLAPWARQVRLTKAGGVEPAVWLLSAEPACRAMRLPVEKEAGGFAVVLPEHRLWSVVVWQDGEETP